MRVNFLRHSSMNLAVSVGAVICAVAFVGLFEQTARAGEPGSPSGTTTISGKQLPPPDPKFGGVIGRNVASRSRGGRRGSCRPKTLPTCS